MSLQEVLKRIEAIENEELQNISKFQYKTACRISEAVGKYAITDSDLTMTNYKGNNLALFTLKTAKRNGIPRTIALPTKNDAWLQQVIELFQTRRGKIFQLAESTVCHLLKEEFKELTYSIDSYRLPIGKDAAGKTVYETVETHERNANSHSLRHRRLSELVNVYGFDDIDTAIFAGWKMRNQAVSPMFSKYVVGQWGRYIDKLLR